MSPGGIPYIRVFIEGAHEVGLKVMWPSDWSGRYDANQAVPQIGSRLMLEGGAAGLTAAQSQHMLKSLSATLRAEGSLGWIGTKLSVPATMLQRAIPVANGHLRAPDWDTVVFEDIRSQVAKWSDGAAFLDGMFRTISYAVYGSSPAQRFLSGETQERVLQVSLDDVKLWYESVFHKRSAQVAIAGAIDAKTAGAAIDGLFDGVADGEAAPLQRPAADTRARRILIHRPQEVTNSIAYVFTLPQPVLSPEKLLVASLAQPDIGLLNKPRPWFLETPMHYESKQLEGTPGSPVMVIYGTSYNTPIAEGDETARTAYAEYRKTGDPRQFEVMRSDWAHGVSCQTADPALAARFAVRARIAGSDLLEISNPEAFFAQITDDMLRQRLRSAFPEPDSFLTIGVSSNVDALPGACVITVPEQAVDCK